MNMPIVLAGGWNIISKYIINIELAKNIQFAPDRFNQFDGNTKHTKNAFYVEDQKSERNKF